jgi:hypothetical protein
MSSFTQFSPDFTAGQIRYLVNGSDSIPGYLKCDGSIVSQATYPKLYAAIGLLPNNLEFTPASNSSGAVIYTVIYGNSQYVRAGAGGRLATSPDAITWTAQTTGTANNISEVIYAGGQYVFVGSSGTIGRSTDGITWNMAVGASGTVFTSPDAITWTQKSTGVVDNLNSVAFGNNVFVIARNGSGIGSSQLLYTDGTTFAAITLTDLSGVLYSITFGNGLFVFTGSFGTIGTSPDGLVWSITTPYPMVGQRIKYDNGLFLYTGWRSATAAFVYVSTDASSWMQLNSNIGNTVYDLCYGTKMVLVGPSNLIATNTLYTYNKATEFALPTSVNIPDKYVQYVANNMAAYIKVN